MCRGPFAYGQATADSTRDMRPSLGSAEVGALVAAALELVEARRARDQHDAVPELAGVLALGCRRDERTEERHALDRDDRRADLLADEVDPLVVGGPQGLVVLG